MSSDVQQLLLSPVPVPSWTPRTPQLVKARTQRRAQRHGNAIQPADTPGNGSRCFTKNVLATAQLSGLRRVFSGALMLANPHLWRFSADKSSGAAKKKSLWGSITVFRPQVGRVTGIDLQNYFVLPPSPKARSTQNPAAAQQAHTALSVTALISRQPPTITRILVHPSTPAPGTREPGSAWCRILLQITCVRSNITRDGDRDRDLSAPQLRASKL